MKNKKSLIYLFFITLIINIFAMQSFAVPNIPQKDANITVSVEADDEECEESDIIKRFSLRDKLKRTPEAQIRSFFKKYNRYASKNNVAKLKELYDDDFINGDGFDKETVFKMMETAASAYSDTTYTTDILSIKVEGNNAVVKVHEVAVGETIKKVSKVNDTGHITSDMYYTDYLKKEGNQWKIISTVIESEIVELKYGEAKNMQVSVFAPECVPAGSEYEVSIKTVAPDGVFLVGSIVNDRIVYPQVQSKDVFKSIKKEDLARLLTANKKNNNEYATMSIAITRAKVEPPSVVLSMTGMAFIMKRINVISANIKEEELDATTTTK